MPGQRIELAAYSMFATTPVYEVDGETVFGLMQDVIVPDATDDVYIVPPGAQGRLDLMADSFYGTPQLWWIIARANDIIDPISAPNTGDKLRIPTKARLSAAGILNV